MNRHFFSKAFCDTDSYKKPGCLRTEKISLFFTVTPGSLSFFCEEPLTLSRWMDARFRSRDAACGRGKSCRIAFRCGRHFFQKFLPLGEKDPGLIFARANMPEHSRLPEHRVIPAKIMKPSVRENNRKNLGQDFCSVYGRINSFREKCNMV